MGQIFDAVVRFFDEEGWRYHQVDEDTILSVPFSGVSGRWNCYAEVKEERSQFVFYSVCPLTAPDHKRLDVAEFLTRANYGLVIGNFEMDFSDGEIRYKTSVRVGDDETLSHDMIKHLVFVNLNMMDRYLPGLMTVMYGKATPLEVIQEIEG